jgi:hypothetical protein
VSAPAARALIRLGLAAVLVAAPAVVARVCRRSRTQVHVVTHRRG